MATAAITNTFIAGTAAEAAQVNTNFTNLVTFLNNSVVHRDGTKAMSAALDLGSQKIVNLATGTASTDAVTKAQLDGLTLGTGNVSGYTTEIGLVDRGPNGTADLTAGTFNLGSNGTYKIAWKQAFGVTQFAIHITLGTGGSIGTWSNGVQLPGNVSSALYLGGASLWFDAVYTDASTGFVYRGAARSAELGDDYLALYYDQEAGNGKMEAIDSNDPFLWAAGDTITISGTCSATWAAL